MKTRQELDDLRGKMIQGEYDYRNAVKENLKEIGKPVRVQGDDEDIEGIEIYVFDCEGTRHFIVDQIKHVQYDNELEDILIHITKSSYQDVDEWIPIYATNEKYIDILDAIQWRKN